MVRRRSRQQSVLSQRNIVDKRLEITAFNYRSGRILETKRPVERFRVALAPGISVQIVNQVAAADYKHAFVAKRCEFLAEFEMKFRRTRFVDAQLNDRHIRLREDMVQNGPRTVIEAPG